LALEKITKRFWNWIQCSSKVYDFEGTRQAMHNQVFPNSVANFLLYFIIITELVLGMMLLFKPTQVVGIYGVFVMMMLFTLYVALVYFRIFDRVPCSCGGILPSIGWGEHLVLNLFLLGIAWIGVWRRGKGISY
jgi:uncharacterized membrane protein YphA (DoxX/SURF4 family)